MPKSFGVEMDDPCIEGTGWRRRGYSVVRHNGKCIGEHRVSYCKHHGLKIEDINGLVVRHRCDNPPCVNPNHLVIGTQLDNIRDRIERGREGDRSGEANGRAKLSSADVVEIRKKYVRGSKEFGQVALAAEYGVRQAHISRILLGKNWE